MHTYSTDNDNRIVVYGLLGVVSWFLIVWIGQATSLLASSVPALAGGTISWGVAFTILSKGFSQKVWKTKISRVTGASKSPDFSGEWDGYIMTSYGGDIPESALHESNAPEADMQRVAASLHIEQTWREIGIHLSTDNSESDSTGATVLTKDGRWPSLTYQYGNKPGADTEPSMASHDGTADLSLKHNGPQDVLEGFYYTGPGRENYGEMYFERRE
ncbi:hypothetical protein [Salinigranum marinum]|uniref:Cap15 family cyclic dinucleotide receptor domain-containing protein n=1 Tax=Salinigranum marinum TaxID=1515595 RepID=UPI002989E6C5|nr:hypothetical protein [Salinigranum marinum]